MRPSRLALSAVILASTLFAPPSPAVFDDVGLDPFLSYTAIAEGMGNAVSARPALPSNIWINPAGMAFQDGLLVYLAPNDQVSDLQKDAYHRVFSAAYRFGEKDVAGAAVILGDFGNVGFRVNSDIIGVTDILETNLMLSYARRLGDSWAAGLTAIGYKQSSDVDLFRSDATAAVTMGVLGRKAFRFQGEYPVLMRGGLSLANLGPEFSVGDAETHLPLTLRLGWSAEYAKDHRNTIVAAADVYSRLRDRENVKEGEVVVRQATDRIGWGVGLEGRFSGVAAVRIGYISDDDVGDNGRSGGTFGFGVGHEVYRSVGGMIEYARAPARVDDTADYLGVKFYWIPGPLSRD